MILILYDTNDVMQYPFLNTIDSNITSTIDPTFIQFSMWSVQALWSLYTHYRMMTDKKRKGDDKLLENRS